MMLQNRVLKTLALSGLLASLLSGCANNSGSSSSARVISNGSPTPITTTAGTIVYNTSSGGNVNTAVQGLLNPTGQLVGTVNPTTGMALAGSVHFGSASQNGGSYAQSMTAGSSVLQIQITDSYATSGQYAPILYEIVNSSTSTGYATNNGSGYSTVLNFSDANGWVCLVGSSNGMSQSSVLTGNIYYGTGAGSDNSYSCQAGTYLGAFTIPLCSFFSCGT